MATCNDLILLGLSKIAKNSFSYIGSENKIYIDDLYVINCFYHNKNHLLVEARNASM